MSLDQILSYVYSVLNQWGIMPFINAALLIVLVFVVIGIIQQFRNR